MVNIVAHLKSLPKVNFIEIVLTLFRLVPIKMQTDLPTIKVTLKEITVISTWTISSTSTQKKHLERKPVEANWMADQSRINIIKTVRLNGVWRQAL